ncbi:MAG TPA: VOC family protein [Longimicrobiaceae bacterium]|nr:VOC family protein [Longimicrobiaceae bacterium]
MNDQNRTHTDAPYGIRPPGYRLPDETRLGAVRLQISDLARSLAYYEQVLGLSVLERSEGRAVLGVQGGAPLVELHERKGATAVPRGGRLGLYHFAILLPDRAALGRFITHLATVGARAGASHHRVSEALYLQDPDGLGIEVYSDLPRSEWTAEEGQLVMSTDPLNLESVVLAAEGKPWTGMPAETTIGHVHLHVGDLERASLFYHEGLGLNKTVWSYPGALFMAAGGYHHHLGVNTWARGAAPATENDARLLGWEVVVPNAEDVNRVLESLTSHGAAVQVADGSGTALDPWGTAMRIRPATARSSMWP